MMVGAIIVRMIPQPPIHLWAVSRADHDWDRREKLRQGNQHKWQRVTSQGQRPFR